MRGATCTFFLLHNSLTISIHAPHARSDIVAPQLASGFDDFNPRSSCEERRYASLLTRGSVGYFNPRSSCEERLSGRSTIWSTLVISIHAPHARSDSRACITTAAQKISIHAPHARSDSATSGRLSMMRYFNPRSSCEERQQNQFYGKAESPISIHAPHARSDSR